MHQKIDELIPITQLRVLVYHEQLSADLDMVKMHDQHEWYDETVL